MTSIRAIALLGVVAVLAACSQAPRTGVQGVVPTKVAPKAPPVNTVSQPAVPVQTVVSVPTAPVTAGVAPVTVAPVAQVAPVIGDVTGEYRIGVDDRIKISVWRNPELSVEVPVRPDGYVSAPLIGDVEAGGMTAEEVARNIEAKLEQYIRQPKVSVILTSLVSHQFLTRVRVTGAINKPLSLPYRQGMTVLDIVLEAGGLSDFAVPSRARLYRKNPETGEPSTTKVRLDKIIYKGDLSTNVELKAGDVLTIPERRF